MWRFYVKERMVAEHVAEMHRQAEAHRLLREAQAGRAGWLSQPRCRARRQLGRFFVSLGERLLKGASPPVFPVEGQVSETA